MGRILKAFSFSDYTVLILDLYRSKQWNISKAVVLIWDNFPYQDTFLVSY